MAAASSLLVWRVLAVALCLLALLASTATAAQTCAVSTDPLTSTPPDFTESIFEGCVARRCEATLGITITSSANGYCDGDATAEAAVDCTTLYTAYRKYYGCLFGTSVQHGVGDAALLTELQQYEATPGLPLHMTKVPCYACNNFRTTVAPSLGANFQCAWNCEDIAPIGISLIRPSEMGKGYNHVLCGIGCMTCMLMGLAFTIISMFVFVCCGCCWPTPSLKTTAAAAAAEEDEAHKQSSEDSDAEEEGEGPNEAQAEEEADAAPAAAASRGVDEKPAEEEDDDEL